MRVVVNHRSSRDEADDVVGSVKSASGQAMAVQADVRDASAVHDMVEQVRAAMGEVEVLVRNALIPYAVKSFDEISWDELGGRLEQEMRAAFLMTKAVVPGMTKRGYGRIVYLGTVLSRRPREGMIALGTSKAALSQFARYVAQEMGPHGITVNMAAPGPVDETAIAAGVLDQEHKERQAAQTALGRIATPGDVARAVAFYAGDDRHRAQENGLRLLAFVGDHCQSPAVGVAVDPTHIAPDDPAVLALVRANRRALRTIRDEPDLAAHYVNALIPSLSQMEARRLYERYVAPYFTADGRHDPSVAARAISSVAEELGVSTVPDAADIYRTEPAEESAA